MTKPDLLLLDEPTNHLDMESIQWLENYLLNYKGAVLIVSHDRYFMDKIVSKVVDVSHHKVNSYTGNYTAYAKKRRRCAPPSFVPIITSSRKSSTRKRSLPS